MYKLYQQVYKLYHRTKTRYVHHIVPIFLEYGTIYTPLVQYIHLLVQLIHFKRLDISPFGMRVLIVVFILYQSVSYHLLGLSIGKEQWGHKKQALIKRPLKPKIKKEICLHNNLSFLSIFFTFFYFQWAKVTSFVMFYVGR